MAFCNTLTAPELIVKPTFPLEIRPSPEGGGRTDPLRPLHLFSASSSHPLKGRRPSVPPRGKGLTGEGTGRGKRVVMIRRRNDVCVHSLHLFICFASCDRMR